MFAWCVWKSICLFFCLFLLLFLFYFLVVCSLHLLAALQCAVKSIYIIKTSYSKLFFLCYKFKEWKNIFFSNKTEYTEDLEPNNNVSNNLLFHFMHFKADNFYGQPNIWFVFLSAFVKENIELRIEVMQIYASYGKYGWHMFLNYGKWLTSYPAVVTLNWSKLHFEWIFVANFVISRAQKAIVFVCSSESFQYARFEKEVSYLYIGCCFTSNGRFGYTQGLFRSSNKFSVAFVNLFDILAVIRCWTLLHDTKNVKLVTKYSVFITLCLFLLL